MKNTIILAMLLFFPLICGAVTSYDTNDDGKADKWMEESSSGYKKVEVDSDYDGVVDRVIRFDSEGNAIYEEYDFDLDGLIDTYYYYGEAGLERQEVDSNSDGEIDIWVYLEEGKYMRSYKRDVDFDGEIDITKDYGSNE